MEIDAPTLSEVWKYIFQAIPAAAILSALGLIFRKAIQDYLTKRISTQFDSRLAILKSNIDEQEKRSTELRGLVVSGVINRRDVRREKELEAVDVIWEATTALSSAILIQKMMDIVDYDYASKAAEKDTKVKEVFKTISESTKVDALVDRLNQINPQRVRLYTPDLLWALYTAYSSILVDYIVRLRALEHGAPKLISDGNEHLKGLVLEALPHQRDVFDKFEKVVPSIFLSTLNKEIIKEAKRVVGGESETEEDVRRAEALSALLLEMGTKPT